MKKFDLEERLIDFAVAIVNLVETSPNKGGQSSRQPVIEIGNITCAELWRSIGRGIEERFPA